MTDADALDRMGAIDHEIRKWARQGKLSEADLSIYDKEPILVRILINELEDEISRADDNYCKLFLSMKWDDLKRKHREAYILRMEGKVEGKSSPMNEVGHIIAASMAPSSDREALVKKLGAPWNQRERDGFKRVVKTGSPWTLPDEILDGWIAQSFWNIGADKIAKKLNADKHTVNRHISRLKLSN